MWRVCGFEIERAFGERAQAKRARGRDEKGDDRGTVADRLENWAE